jgi:hypothetical protein
VRAMLSEEAVVVRMARGPGWCVEERVSEG